MKLNSDLYCNYWSTGAIIVKEGCRANKFYILNEGNARIVKDGEQIGDQSAGMCWGVKGR